MTTSTFYFTRFVLFLLGFLAFLKYAWVATPYVLFVLTKTKTLELPVVAIMRYLVLLFVVAFYTLAERKIMAAIQRRRGPNVVGYNGLLQPIADALKLIGRGVILPQQASGVFFIAAPTLILALSLSAWAIIPFRSSLIYPVVKFSMFKAVELEAAILFILAVSSVSAYGMIIAGWSSNSKYAFLGALRTAAQMISYEVSMGLTILPVALLSGTFTLSGISLAQKKTGWFIFPLLPCALIFLISMIAETNRTPFDLPEAEAELVAGYNTDYASMAFAIFFLAEYANMIFMSTLFAFFFLGGCSAKISGLVFKILCLSVIFVIVRAALPRYRYDQLMDIGWKIFLPVTTALFAASSGLLVAFDCYPMGALN